MERVTVRDNDLRVDGITPNFKGTRTVKRNVDVVLCSLKHRDIEGGLTKVQGHVIAVYRRVSSEWTTDWTTDLSSLVYSTTYL